MNKKTWEQAEVHNFNFLKDQGKNVFFNNSDAKYNRAIPFENKTFNHPDFKMLNSLGASEKARCLRGDITEILEDGSKNIYDVKNYCGLRNNLGSDKVNKNNFVKTLDSNFDYAFQLISEKIIENFFENNSFLGKMDGRDFIDFFMKFEISRYHKMLKINNKFLIINENGKFIRYKIDLSSIKNKSIRVDSYSPNNGYKYIQFSYDGQIFYEMSQRDNGIPNCSILDKKFLIKQDFKEKIIMPKAYKDEIISFIKQERSVNVEDIVKFVMNTYRSYFEKSLISKNLIRVRILKDLNPDFKSRCKIMGIKHDSQNRTYYL